MGKGRVGGVVPLLKQTPRVQGVLGSVPSTALPGALAESGTQKVDQKDQSSRLSEVSSTMNAKLI